MKLVRLIETHSEILSQNLTEHIRTSDRTSDFHKIPAEELQRAARELYHNLGDWLLQKTEKDIARRFRAIGAQRAAEGVRLHQFTWALILTRDHLWHFLRQEAFADNIVELHAELELQQLLNQFFDRAVYYGVVGYEDASRKIPPKTDLQRARDLAIAIGLMSARPAESRHRED
ncbi:MAG: hypothetical protein WAM79_15840 [Candidatus Sulfotelmatobacter sp.]